VEHNIALACTQSAAEIYFNKNVKDLNLAQCAMLAAIPKSPNHYNPFRNARAALSRRNLVLSRMKQLGCQTEKQEKEAIKTPLLFVKDISLKEKKGDYFMEGLRFILEPKYGTNVLFRDECSVYTTSDMQAQTAAEKLLKNILLILIKIGFY
jgi:penicillin-binding protein 1A